MTMYRGGSSRIFPALIVVAVIVVAIIALVAIGRAIFGGGSDTAPEENPARRSLLTTDADHSLRMTVRGPLVADEEFRSYVVDVSPVERSLTTYTGYEYQQLDNVRFVNSTEAYAEFVHALEQASFLREQELSDEEDDTRGVCAGGRLYTFEIRRAQSDLKRLWTSSCRDESGSFRGEAERVKNLFLRQIPDSAELLRPIDLSL